MNLVERIAATQKTVDCFKERKFAMGRDDCVHLILAHARHMGREIDVPRYGSARTAVAALKQFEAGSLADALDKHFTRIEQCQVLAGDIVEMPGMNGFSSLSVAVGNGRVLGFHESIPHADVLQPLMISGAWRIDV